jgi:hypothetical protein
MTYRKELPISDGAEVEQISLVSRLCLAVFPKVHRLKWHDLRRCPVPTVTYRLEEFSFRDIDKFLYETGSDYFRS